MEMNKNNDSVPACEDVRNVAEKRKPLTPAILGIPNSHGVKLSVNMTSEDKKEFLAKLEEWRKARKQKLAASIIGKQKQADKCKPSLPSVPLKSKPVSMGENGSSKFQDRQSVFERLYQNSGKVKKHEVIVSCNKQQQISGTSFKKAAILPFNKFEKPEKATYAERDGGENFYTLSKSNPDAKIKQEPFSYGEGPIQNYVNSVRNTGLTEVQVTENCFVGVTEEKSNKGMNLKKPVHLMSDKVKITGSQSFTHGPVLKNSSMKSFEGTKGKTSLRRSVSMMFRQKHKTEGCVRRSVSSKNLHEMNLNAPIADHRSFQTPQHGCDTKSEVTKSVMFATPKSTKLLTSTHLRTRLENWLKVNGHSLEGYRHLRCFGVHDTGKPLVKTIAVAPDDSHYGTTPNTPEVDSNKENVTPPTVVQQADAKDVENWLKELHRLIVELKYPPERCEEWLVAIRKKCTICSKLPIYWECLAALHESKGDLKSAIEDYERAIIKGGEVDSVGESLAQLFDKMVIEQKRRSKPKLEKGLDPKNIFKSTIIKFALQQKAIKKLSSEMEPGVRQQLYIATPVRRSTRLQTPFKSNDEIPSLQTLTPEFRKNVTFKPNESLLNGD